MDRDGSSQVTMPKWPAWIMLAVMAASAYPALTASTPTVSAQKPSPSQGAAPKRMILAH